MTELLSVLKSKDESVFRDYSWLWDGTSHFLDQKESLLTEHENHVTFTSYPRSGNSFLRKYVEQITGIATGSTMPIHVATSLQL